MKKKKQDKIEEEFRKIVIARLDLLPSGKKVSIGSEGEFSRDELIKRVEQGDEIGEKITEIQREYLTSLKEGVFYE